MQILSPYPDIKWLEDKTGSARSAPTEAPPPRLQYCLLLRKARENAILSRMKCENPEKGVNV